MERTVLTRPRGSEDQDWVPLSEFPGYFINPFGEIINERGGSALRFDINQRGIVHVSLYYRRRQFRRSVAKLVALAFLPTPKFSHFNTITHLDGDKTNIYARNLMWRPLWYSREYHAQFESPDPSWEIPVEIVKTGEFYERAIDFCMDHGILVRQVVDALLDDKPLPLIWMSIRSPELSPLSEHDTF